MIKKKKKKKTLKQWEKNIIRFALLFPNVRNKWLTDKGYLAIWNWSCSFLVSFCLITFIIFVFLMIFAPFLFTVATNCDCCFCFKIRFYFIFFVCEISNRERIQWSEFPFDLKNLSLLSKGDTRIVIIEYRTT